MMLRQVWGFAAFGLLAFVGCDSADRDFDSAAGSGGVVNGAGSGGALVAGGGTPATNAGAGGASGGAPGAGESGSTAGSPGAGAPAIGGAPAGGAAPTAGTSAGGASAGAAMGGGGASTGGGGASTGGGGGTTGPSAECTKWCSGVTGVVTVCAGNAGLATTVDTEAKCLAACKSVAALGANGLTCWNKHLDFIVSNMSKDTHCPHASGKAANGVCAESK